MATSCASPACSKMMAPLIAVFFLGLAPHSPEPHLVEKIRWMFDPAKDLAMIDWFDVLMHGAPWVWLAWVIKQSFFPKKAKAVIETEVLKVGKE